MKQFIHLLKHDFLILQRNRIISLSFVVALIYVGAFKLLSAVGDIEKLLVVIIYNDPALLGLLFAGVLVLFEKNEYTFQALSVTPVSIQNYILSKATALTVIAVISAFAMVFAGYGFDFNYFHFGMATIFSTLTFAFLGFVLVATKETFNQYMLVASGMIILFMTPFLGFFEVLPKNLFWIIPSHSSIQLFSAAFNGFSTVEIIMYYAVCAIWCFFMYKLAVNRIHKKLKS